MSEKGIHIVPRYHSPENVYRNKIRVFFYHDKKNNKETKRIKHVETVILDDFCIHPSLQL